MTLYIVCGLDVFLCYIFINPTHELSHAFPRKVKCLFKYIPNIINNFISCSNANVRTALRYSGVKPPDILYTQKRTRLNAHEDGSCNGRVLAFGICVKRAYTIWRYNACGNVNISHIRFLYTHFLNGLLFVVHKHDTTRTDMPKRERDTSSTRKTLINERQCLLVAGNGMMW